MKKVFLFVFMGILLFSCAKEDEPEPEPEVYPIGTDYIGMEFYYNLSEKIYEIGEAPIVGRWQFLGDKFTKPNPLPRGWHIEYTADNKELMWLRNPSNPDTFKESEYKGFYECSNIAIKTETYNGYYIFIVEEPFHYRFYLQEGTEIPAFEFWEKYQRVDAEGRLILP